MNNNNIYKEKEENLKMPIVGFNIEKLYVEKKKPIEGNVRIKNDMTIKEIVKDDKSSSTEKEGILKFIFEFSTEYQEGIGNIEIGGYVLYLDDKKKIKEILERWNKEKSMETDLLTRILNIILMKCNIKALELSQEMNLPPNIKIPTVSPKSNVNDYIG